MFAEQESQSMSTDKPDVLSDAAKAVASSFLSADQLTNVTKAYDEVKANMTSFLTKASVQLVANGVLPVMAVPDVAKAAGSIGQAIKSAENPSNPAQVAKDVLKAAEDIGKVASQVNVEKIVDKVTDKVGDNVGNNAVKEIVKACGDIVFPFKIGNDQGTISKLPSGTTELNVKLGDNMTLSLGINPGKHTLTLDIPGGLHVSISDKFALAKLGDSQVVFGFDGGRFQTNGDGTTQFVNPKGDSITTLADGKTTITKLAEHAVKIIQSGSEAIFAPVNPQDTAANNDFNKSFGKTLEQLKSLGTTLGVITDSGTPTLDAVSGVVKGVKNVVRHLPTELLNTTISVPPEDLTYAAIKTLASDVMRAASAGSVEGFNKEARKLIGDVQDFFHKAVTQANFNLYDNPPKPGLADPQGRTFKIDGGGKLEQVTYNDGSFIKFSPDGKSYERHGGPPKHELVEEVKRQAKSDASAGKHEEAPKATESASKLLSADTNEGALKAIKQLEDSAKQDPKGQAAEYLNKLKADLKSEGKDLETVKSELKNMPGAEPLGEDYKDSFKKSLKERVDVDLKKEALEAEKKREVDHKFEPSFNREGGKLSEVKLPGDHGSLRFNEETKAWEHYDKDGAREFLSNVVF